MKKSLKLLCKKIIKKVNNIFAFFRRKRINNLDFTIISNNCWGGKCYEFFNMEKLSPTIGCYFFASDYIKFLNRLKYYLNKEINMINAKDSKYYDILKQKDQLNIPIGKIEDIEIVFLHYKDPKIAKAKWERRIKRVNYDNIIFKFSYMNECTEKDLYDFDRIKGVKKILFITKNNEHHDNAYIYENITDGLIENDTKDWNKHFNIYKFLNTKPTSIKDLKILNK